MNWISPSSFSSVWKHSLVFLQDNMCLFSWNVHCWTISWMFWKLNKFMDVLKAGNPCFCVGFGILLDIWISILEPDLSGGRKNHFFEKLLLWWLTGRYGLVFEFDEVLFVACRFSIFWWLWLVVSMMTPIALRAWFLYLLDCYSSRAVLCLTSLSSQWVAIFWCNDFLGSLCPPLILDNSEVQAPGVLVFLFYPKRPLLCWALGDLAHEQASSFSSAWKHSLVFLQNKMCPLSWNVRCWTISWMSWKLTKFMDVLEAGNLCFCVGFGIYIYIYTYI